MVISTVETFVDTTAKFSQPERSGLWLWTLAFTPYPENLGIFMWEKLGGYLKLDSKSRTVTQTYVISKMGWQINHTRNTGTKENAAKEQRVKRLSANPVCKCIIETQQLRQMVLYVTLLRDDTHVNNAD